MNDLYCINCDRLVPVWQRKRRVYIPARGVHNIISCEFYAVCQYCGAEVYDPALNDINVEIWKECRAKSEEVSYNILPRE